MPEEMTSGTGMMPLVLVMPSPICESVITDDQGDHVPFLFFFLVNIRPVEPIGIVYLVDFLSGLRSLDARICQGHCCPKKM